MSTVTYSDPEVQKYISDNFIPVQVNVVEQPDAMDAFGASWTPTIIIQDADELEHRRIVGYFDPKRFMEELSLARLQSAIDTKDFEGARNRVAEALNMTQGDPVREPETLYWSAVTDYKSSHNAEELKKGWKKLLEKYPDSEWARRADIQL